MDEKETPYSLEEIQTADLGGWSNYAVTGRLRHPDTSLDVLQYAAHDPRSSYNVLSTVAEHKNTNEELLEELVEKSHHRWEWRSCASKFRRNFAVNSDAYPENAAYPEAAINSLITNSGEAATYVTKCGGKIAEDLWHDLATREIVELSYQRDHVDGDQFGVYSYNKIYAEGVVEFFLSPGYFCTWIDTVPDPDRHYLEDNFLEYHNEEYLENEEWNDSDELSDLVEASSIVALTYGVANGHLTIQDETQYLQLLVDNAEVNDPERVDVSVVITDKPEIDGPRYADLTTAQKTLLIANLISASQHYLHNKWGTAGHLLSLILLHPLTPQKHKDIIISADPSGARTTIEFLQKSE